MIANGLISYQGLRSRAFMDKYSFQVDEILINKDYIRLVSSGFLHVSWLHLGFNMLTLYYFSGDVETLMGVNKFLLIYFGSLIGGDLFALYIHRNHYDYSAVGASGAISGIVFASIALFPGMEIGFFGLPFFMPGWIYGLLYVLVSIYGIKSQRDNIGHEAHLGGGLIGLLIAVAMVPSTLKYNYLPIVLIIIPCIIFIYLILTKPEFLLINTVFRKPKRFHTVEDRYYNEKQTREQELDKLLEKIGKTGMGSLSNKERERLKQLSGGK